MILVTSPAAAAGLVALSAGHYERKLRSQVSVNRLTRYDFRLLPHSCDHLVRLDLPMRVGLFIPCYVDQFYPQVGMATVRVLRRFGVTDLHFPEGQTCCGQPMANTGCTDHAAPLAKRFLDVFSEFDYVVGPTGSCVAMVRHHYESLLGDHARVEAVGRKTFELCEFLTDVLGVERVAGSFPHQVGLHNACHGLRELRLAQDSERVGPAFNKALRLLEGLDGITLSELSRPDECCGFGGTFAVGEEAVSCLMGLDRLADHVRAGTSVLTASDMSCLMHLEGLLRRQGLPIRVMHIAEILDQAGAVPARAPVREAATTV